VKVTSTVPPTPTEAADGLRVIEAAWAALKLTASNPTAKSLFIVVIIVFPYNYFIGPNNKGLGAGS
jgi:hypothetical protein